MKIAVDAMGGDNAPQAIIAGVEQARDQYADLEFQLFGDPAQVKPLIKNDERLTVIETTEEITMGEEPVRAIRRKKDSSIVRAARMPSSLPAIPVPYWRPAFLSWAGSRGSTVPA